MKGGILKEEKEKEGEDEEEKEEEEKEKTPVQIMFQKSRYSSRILSWYHKKRTYERGRRGYLVAFYIPTANSFNIEFLCWDQNFIKDPIIMPDDTIFFYVMLWDHVDFLLLLEFTCDVESPIPKMDIFKEYVGNVLVLGPNVTNCGNCKVSEAKKSCSKCHKVVYCGKDCQKEHWPIHKVVCRELVFDKPTENYAHEKVGEKFRLK